MNKQFFPRTKVLTFSFLVALESIILYLVITIPLEYLTTEKYLIFKFISGATKSWIFLLSFLVIFVFNFLLGKKICFNQKTLVFILLLFSLSVLGSRQYSNYFSKLQQYPKIFSISSDWVIQGMSVSIEGKNFGPAWEVGKVMIGNFEFKQIQYWSEGKIIVTAPVPARFLKTDLRVINANGKESNRVNFEIKNPSQL